MTALDRMPIMPGQTYEFVGPRARRGTFQVIGVTFFGGDGPCRYEITFRGIRDREVVEWAFHVAAPFADDAGFAAHHRLVESAVA